MTEGTGGRSGAHLAAATQGAPVRVVSVGLGAIGETAFRQLSVARGVELLAAVDPAREGEIFEGTTILGELGFDGAYSGAVAVLATGSSIPEVADQVVMLVERGMHVVTSCESLVYPWRIYPDAARRIDTAARVHSCSVVATGVNPGFVMDVLPVLLLSTCLDADAIKVVRRVDLSRRRPQLPQKLGVGLSEAEWWERLAEGALGHAGLVESAFLCAASAGWQITEHGFERSPTVSDGTVTGIEEIASVRASGGRHVELRLVFRAQGVDCDRVEIAGSTPLKVEMSGLSGDTATVARLVQAVRVVSEMSPGLRTPVELPVALPPLIRVEQASA